MNGPAWFRGGFGPDRRMLPLALLLVVTLMFSACTQFSENLLTTPRQTSIIGFVSPSAVEQGSEAFVLEVCGVGFVQGSTVRWNGQNRTTRLRSRANDPPGACSDAVWLEADITAQDVAVAGQFQVVVASPGPDDGNNLSNRVSVCVHPPGESSCDNLPASALQAQAAEAALFPGDLRSPAITAGPRYVAFVAVSADPSIDASTGIDKIFLQDTCVGAAADCSPNTTLVSAGPDGAEPNGPSRSPAISADGRFVVFVSEATNLVPDDTNGAADIFLRDTCNGAPEGCVPATVRVSVGPDNAEANDESAAPSISPDGRLIAFDSAATNLVLDGSSARTAAYLRDTCYNAPEPCVPSTTRLTFSLAAPR